MSGQTTQNAQIRVLDTSVSPNVYNDIGCVTDFNGPSGSRAVIDTTCLDSTGREKNVGIPDFGQVTLNLIFSLTVADQHIALWTDFKNGGKETYRIIIPTSPEEYIQFGAYVLGFQLQGQIDDVFRAAVTLEIDGGVTDSF